MNIHEAEHHHIMNPPYIDSFPSKTIWTSSLHLIMQHAANKLNRLWGEKTEFGFYFEICMSRQNC